MELSEEQKRNNKIADCVAELNSYCKILADYVDAHEEIDEMLHASLIVDKMQENITTLYKIFYRNE